MTTTDDTGHSATVLSAPVTSSATSTAPAEAFFDDMDAAKQAGGRSCCTLWTLGLCLIVILGFGLWVIFGLL